MNMKQFTQLLVLIILSSYIPLSASNFHRIDTIGKFNEVTDIEMRLKSLQGTDLISNENKRTIQKDTIVKSNDSTVLLHDSLAYLSDSLGSSLDTIHREPYDSIMVSSDTVILTPSDSIITDSIKIDTIALPEKKKSVFTPIAITTSLDTIYSRKSNGTIELPEPIESSFDMYSSRLSFRDTMIYNPLFLPVVFTGRIESPDSAFIYPEKKIESKEVLISPDKTFAPLISKQTFANKVRRVYFLENPSLIKLSTSTLSGSKQTVSDTDVREKFNPFKELLSSETSFSLESPELEGTKIDRVYWVKSGEHSLQVSQNYFSPNWHKGGTSNFNINNYHVFRANYAKNKVRFNNMFEWRLSLYNAPDDSIREYRIGDDLLRYYGDFGFDAYKKTWSYSTNLEAKTQMFNSHIPNKEDIRSAFLAPLYVNAGIGMKYNLDKRSESVRHRRIRLSVAISPLSVSYKYVGNKDVDEKRFGIPEGKKSIFDKGSTLTSLLTYDITKYITWTARLKYFTNYSKVESELENTLNMSLSRFFSTRLYLHLRYDDGVPKDSDYGFLQVNEVVSFGLNFKW